MPTSRLLHHLYTEDEFVFSALVGAGQTFTLPLEASGTYSFHVIWGDGNKDVISAWDDAAKTHTYTNAGMYTIVISGSILGWRFNDGGDDTKMRDIKNWGCLRLGNNGNAFSGCTYLSVTATDILDLSGMTTLSYLFHKCQNNLTTVPSMNDWDVSNITDLGQMLYSALVFDQPLNNWDVSSVTDMGGTFNNAQVFNQPLNNWDVSSVTNMRSTFDNAYLFNQDIDCWTTSAVTNMYHLFTGAKAFNQPLNSWDVSAVQDMDGLFMNAQAFNQPLDNWTTSAVTTMMSVFNSALVFNQDLSAWDVSNVIEMAYMFQTTNAFNQPLNAWDVSSVIDMSAMFSDAHAFNQPLNNWNTISVEEMNSMFHLSAGVMVFDQDVGSWNVTSVDTMDNMFYGIALSTANYDSLLTGYEGQAVLNNVKLGGGNSKYSAGAAATARAALIADHNWAITDGGQV